MLFMVFLFKIFFHTLFRMRLPKTLPYLLWNICNTDPFGFPAGYQSSQTMIFDTSAICPNSLTRIESDRHSLAQNRRY